MFQTNPNQRNITINRKDALNSGRQYLAINCDTLAEASRNISGEVPFKLYLYLASNKNGYEFSFSPQHFSNIYGCSIDASRKAFAKLVEANYIINKGNNSFEFFETPQERRPRLVVEPERRKYKGFVMTYEEVYEDLKEGGWLDSRIEDFWNNEMEVIK